MFNKKVQKRQSRRALLVRKKLREQKESKVRISVYKSLNNIHVQAIDDSQGKTLVACSSLQMKDIKGDKKAVSKAVGQEFGKKALEAGISTACFDRGRFLYHGRIKALADGIREAGLNI